MQLLKGPGPIVCTVKLRAELLKLIPKACIRQMKITAVRNEVLTLVPESDRDFI
jgi:hypothetical protein